MSGAWTQWPTPWKHDLRHGFDYGDILDASGVRILSGAVNNQLRDRLLTSVNAHDQLVEACTAALVRLAEVEEVTDMPSPDTSKLLRAAIRAALSITTPKGSG